MIIIPVSPVYKEKTARCCKLYYVLRVDLCVDPRTVWMIFFSLVGRSQLTKKKENEKKNPI